MRKSKVLGKCADDKMQKQNGVEENESPEDATKESRIRKAVGVAGILLASLPFVIGIAVVTGHAPAILFEMFFNTDSNSSLFSIIALSITYIAIPALLSAILVYPYAFHKGIKLYKIIYALDTFLMCWSVIPPLLWAMVAPM